MIKYWVNRFKVCLANTTTTTTTTKFLKIKFPARDGNFTQNLDNVRDYSFEGS